jgi:hypothetical protein
LLPALPSAWVDQEFFISCSSPQITYRTLVDVRRPVNPQRASGNVVVEPLHSGGIWGLLTNLQPYLVDNGDVHVGVAANSVVVNRLVKPADPTRYSTLNVPATAGAENQILAGVGGLLHSDPDTLLPDIGVKDTILGGWSETSVQTRSFINFVSSAGGAADVTANGEPVYDGYFPAQAAVGTSGQAELGPIPDVGVPVVELQGERELLETLRVYGNLGYRRADSDTYRLYEVPGMAHITSEPDDPASTYSLSVPCDRPPGAVPSMFKQTQVWAMALDNLITWVTRGQPAPQAPRIELNGNTVVRDANGNALRGVRTVYLDVATATVVPTSLNPGGLPGNPCGQIGYQLNFSQQKLVDLYSNHGGYVSQFVKDAHRLVAERWLLPQNASQDIVEAAQSAVPSTS